MVNMKEMLAANEETKQLMIAELENQRAATLEAEAKKLRTSAALRVQGVKAPGSDPTSPDYYRVGGIETIDFIKAKSLDYYLGNAVKYISRAGKKDPEKEAEDLRKAIWYLNRKIAEIEKV